MRARNSNIHGQGLSAPYRPHFLQIPRQPPRDAPNQVLESTLVNGERCLVVFKNGPSTGVTIGKANNVSSYTGSYFAGQYQESRE